MVRGVNPLRYGDSDEGSSTDWFSIVRKFLVPGMLVAAVIAVALIQMQNSGGLSGDGASQGIFYDMGKAMFSLK